MPTGSSAQQFLTIDTIHDDVVVLKSGGLRVVLMCSSINFALKSPDEQEAIIFQYQNFLNSLDFPIQFAIHSRRLNIAPYLEALQERQKEEQNELLKLQISEYSEFVKTFTESTNIMSKTFYVVVPFTPATMERGGIFEGIFSKIGIGGKPLNSKEQFGEYRNQLWQRVEAVIAGLHSFGVRAVPLNGEELIELFYGLYNPTEFEKVGGTKS